MGIIKTGIDLSKTIKNVARLKEILTVFARHGFSEFVNIGMQANIPDFVIPTSKKKALKEELAERSQKEWPEIIGKRLRECFEELGPAFIKLGQILSSREDIFDQGFIKEMKFLRDKVKGVPFDQLRPILERSIPHYSENIESIEEQAIGTASIGIVFKAKLKNGDDVVLKVRRPGIEKLIQTDISILHFLASQLEKLGPEIKYLGISRIIRDFSYSIQSELNFNIECLNCKKLKANLESHDLDKIFYIPNVYPELSSDNVLVMEYIDGIPFSDHGKIGPLIPEITPKLENGIEIFLKTFLNDGFFHADLHGGNFFYQKDGRIALIDFGLMGNLSKKNRLNFMAIIFALISYNYENLVFEFLDVAEYEKSPDVDELISDVRESLTPFVGLTVAQTNFSHALKSVVRTLSEHEIFLPREWFVVFRAFITLDGVGKSLGMDFDLFTSLEKDIKELIKDSFTKEDLIEESMWAARDLSSIYRIFPRHLKWFLKDIAKKNYQIPIELNGQKDSFNNLARALFSLGYCLVGFGFAWMFFKNLDTVDISDVTLWSAKAVVCLIISLGFFLMALFERLKFK